MFIIKSIKTKKDINKQKETYKNKNNIFDIKE